MVLGRHLEGFNDDLELQLLVAVILLGIKLRQKNSSCQMIKISVNFVKSCFPRLNRHDLVNGVA